jgi:hypothetical protein
MNTGISGLFSASALINYGQCVVVSECTKVFFATDCIFLSLLSVT